MPKINAHHISDTISTIEPFSRAAPRTSNTLEMRMQDVIDDSGEREILHMSGVYETYAGLEREQQTPERVALLRRTS